MGGALEALTGGALEALTGGALEALTVGALEAPTGGAPNEMRATNTPMQIEVYLKYRPNVLAIFAWYVAQLYVCLIFVLLHNLFLAMYWTLSCVFC